MVESLVCDFFLGLISLPQEVLQHRETGLLQPGRQRLRKTKSMTELSVANAYNVTAMFPNLGSFKPMIKMMMQCFAVDLMVVATTI